MMGRRDNAMIRARRDFEAFHWGDESTEILDAQAPELHEGDVLVVLGKLRAVEYDTAKKGQDATWCHQFDEDDQPRLCATADGQLVIVGGSYRVTPRGIVG
jgi:hypothetical protein